MKKFNQDGKRRRELIRRLTRKKEKSVDARNQADTLITFN